jgi:hypothetical protein
LVQESRAHKPTKKQVSRSLVLLLKGGLGNQLFQVGAGLEAARSHGAQLRLATPAYLHDRKRQAQAPALFPELQRCAAWTEVLLAPLTREPIARHRWIDGIVLHDGNFTTVGRGASLRVISGYFQHQRFSAPVAQRLRQRCNDEVVQLPAEFVAVHVRRGDFLKLAGLRRDYDQLMTSYYPRALEVASQEVDPAAPIFVVSDEPAAALADLASRLGHLARRLHISPTKGIWQDLALMSRATRLVASNSTFGWWSARANRAERVLLPRSWIEFESQRVGYDFDLKIPGARLL